MPFDEKSKEFRRQSIYLFFKLGFEVYDTVEHLKIEFRDVTFQEIDAWFARFKTGSKDLETDVVIDNRARGLDSVPVNLKRKIMESVDYNDQKSLLATNQSFRNILKADRRIFSSLKLSLGLDSLGLSLGNDVTGTEVIRFIKSEEGCERKIGEEVTVLSGSYIEEGMKRFRKVIEKFGTKIEQMNISCKNFEKFTDKTDVQIFNSEVGKAMNGLKIHVEKLDFQLYNKEDLYPVLEGIKVGALNILLLQTHGKKFRYSFNDNPFIEQHFPHFHQMTSNGADFDIPLEAYANISLLVTDVEVIKPDALKIYRDKILTSDTFRDHTIFGRYDREKIREVLKPFDSADEFDEADGFLTTPGKKPIKFTFSTNFMDFRREDELLKF